MRLHSYLAAAVTLTSRLINQSDLFVRSTHSARTWCVISEFTRAHTIMPNLKTADARPLLSYFVAFNSLFLQLHYIFTTILSTWNVCILVSPYEWMRFLIIIDIIVFMGWAVRGLQFHADMFLIGWLLITLDISCALNFNFMTKHPWN